MEMFRGDTGRNSNEGLFPVDHKLKLEKKQTNKQTKAATFVDQMLDRV